MNGFRIEAWAREVIERVNTNKPHEDFRVELKSEWPADSEKFARQLAGHANAARGEKILWLIGVDEDRGVVGAEQREMANLYPEVKSKFDGPAPTVIDHNLNVDGETVVALLFETDHYPFVVKNPKFGTPDGGPVEREIPWREATSTRSATRDDLFQLLIPIMKLPEIEVLEGHLYYSLPRNAHVEFELTLYVVPRSDDLLVLPIHRCSAKIGFQGIEDPIEYDELRFNYPSTGWLAGQVGSSTIETSGSEAIIHAPGKFFVNGERWLSQQIDFDISKSVELQVWLRPVNVDRSVPINIELEPADPGRIEGHWAYNFKPSGIGDNS